MQHWKSDASSIIYLGTLGRVTYHRQPHFICEMEIRSVSPGCWVKEMWCSIWKCFAPRIDLYCLNYCVFLTFMALFFLNGFFISNKVLLPKTHFNLLFVILSCKAWAGFGTVSFWSCLWVEERSSLIRAPGLLGPLGCWAELLALADPKGGLLLWTQLQHDGNWPPSTNELLE